MVKTSHLALRCGADTGGVGKAATERAEDVLSGGGASSCVCGCCCGCI